MSAALGREGETADAGVRGKPKKAPNAFRTISEVADELHIPQHVLRFWETKFPLVKPLKRGGGRRYYRPDDITLLRRVSDLLYIQGYTIKGVQRLLREGGGRLSDDIPPAPQDDRADGDGEPENLAPPQTSNGAMPVAAASGDDIEPQLPMPGLTPPPGAVRRAGARQPLRATVAKAEADAAAPTTGLAAEVDRLRGVLARALRELEALRATLR